MAAVDEAVITGEVNPVTRSPGSTALAGTTVKEGSIELLVTRLESNDSLSAVVSSLSQGSSTKYHVWADRLAGYFLWIATAIALLSLLIWTLVTRYVRQESWPSAVTNGVSVRTVDVGSRRSNDGTDAQQEMERIDGSFGRTSRNVSRWNRTRQR